MTQGFTTSNDVKDVLGTSNRITVTGGTTKVVDISGSYVGQASITTLGTVTTGTWQGTAIDETAGGTGQTSYTTGDILYASASNTLTKLAAGTTGQVLKQGASVPEWGSSSGVGSWQYISSVTASSSATVEFTSGINLTYDVYAFVFKNLTFSNDQVTLRCRTSTDGGTTFDAGAGNYSYVIKTSTSSAGETYMLIAAESTAAANIGNAAGENLSGQFFMFNPSETSNFKNFTGTFTWNDSGSNVQTALSTACRESTANIDAIQFYASAGTINAGTIKMYGLLPS